MKLPSFIIASAKKTWKWQWIQMMNYLAPSDGNGNYSRPQNSNIDSIKIDPKKIRIRSKNNLPILFIGKSCPWAHRTWLMIEICSLHEDIILKNVLPNKEKGLWEIEEKILGCKYLNDVYSLCGFSLSHRATVPTLFDPVGTQKNYPEIIGNESTKLVEIFSNYSTLKGGVNMNPTHLKSEIDSWDLLFNDSLNNGVYKCGFARNQNAYNKAIEHLFSSLDTLEKSLENKGPWICGEMITIADVRIFPTLIRWESIYQPFFGCSKKPLWEYKNIFEWRKRFFNFKNISKTCNTETWRKDYYGSLFPLNPRGIINEGPDIELIVKGAN